jgi:hypothetical protein
MAERLHPDDLEALADLVAERLAQFVAGVPQTSPAPSPRGGLVTAAVLAERLGVTADTVRAHADALGAVRIGEGPKPRLRFDLEQALSAWATRDRNRVPHPTESPVAERRTPRRRSRATRPAAQRVSVPPWEE